MRRQQEQLMRHVKVENEHKAKLEVWVQCSTLSQ